MIHTASAEIPDAETEQQRTAHKAIQVTVDTAVKQEDKCLLNPSPYACYT